MARNQDQQLCLVTVMHEAQTEWTKAFTSKEGNSVIDINHLKEII